MSEAAATIGSALTEILAFDGVSFAYPGESTALHYVDLRIAPGEAVALCGPNGSGKTTLLKLAAGLLAPSSGIVKLGGMPLDNRGRREAYRLLGFLFQEADDQLFCPTVREDIAYGPTNLGVAKAEIADRVREVLGIMGIPHLASRPVHHLSGGEKKRVALAGLLAMQTRVMALDEPTGGLDPSGARELTATLRMLNRDYGQTLLVATHDIDRIPEFATRVIILHEGGVYRDGTVRDILTDVPALEAIGLEAPIIARYFHEKYRRTGKAHLPIPLDLDEALGIQDLEVADSSS